MKKGGSLHRLVRNMRRGADLAMRCRLMANRIDPENPSRDFPPMWELRDLLNDAARALEALGTLNEAGKRDDGL